MNYSDIVKRIRSLKEDTDAPLDLYVLGAITGVFHMDKLPPKSEAAVLLTAWRLSGDNSVSDEGCEGGVCDFYSAQKDRMRVNDICDLLRSEGLADVADIVKKGMAGVKRAEKDDRYFYKWAAETQSEYDEWEEHNVSRLHNATVRWVKSDAAELEKVFENTKMPFDEAIRQCADILRGFGEEEDAFTLFLCAAEEGNADAMFDVASYYAIVEGDAKKASEWCEKAADGGCVDAQLQSAREHKAKGDFSAAFARCKAAAVSEHPLAYLMLGTFYKNGDGVDKDSKLAVSYLQKAADASLVDAYGELAPLYENGDGIERDRLRAVEYYSIAAISGVPSAQEKLRQYPDISDYIAKADEIEKMAKDGDVYAIYALACFAEYREDDETSEKYYKKAAELWAQKAEAGDVESMICLGLCYQHEHGVESEGGEPLELFTRAESLGEPFASYCIAHLYEGGDGVKYSPKLGNKYYQIAAEAGNPDAMMYLGRNLDEGYGIKKDTQKAVYWLERAANEGGDTCAHHCLADIYEKIYHDKQKARELRVSAAEKGDRSAQVRLAKDVLEKKFPELWTVVDNKARDYEYTEFYDDIFERIKDRLPFRKERTMPTK